MYEYILRYHLASLKTQGHGLRARPLGQAGRGGSRPRGGWVGGDPAGARGMTSGRSTATPLFSAAQRSVSIEIGFDYGQLSPFALPDQVVCIRSPIVFGSWRVVPSTLLDPQDVFPEQGHICITSTGDPFQQHGNLPIPEPSHVRISPSAQISPRITSKHSPANHSSPPTPADRPPINGLASSPLRRAQGPDQPSELLCAVRVGVMGGVVEVVREERVARCVLRGVALAQAKMLMIVRKLNDASRRAGAVLGRDRQTA